MKPKPSVLSARLFPVLMVVLLALVSGCAIQKAQTAFNEGRYEEAMQAYHEILRQDPANVKARIGLQRSASRAAEQHLANAREAERAGDDARVEKEVREAFRLDPTNALAQEWITRFELKRRRAQAGAADDSIEVQRLKGESKSAILLTPRSLEGMDLNFTRKTSLRDILGAISRNSGVSILFHSSFQDTAVSADLRGLSFQRILDTLMIQSDLFYKVIDTNTIMVFKNTPQNREQFENQLIKTFYLSNANPDDVRSIFQTLMPQLKVFVDKRLNAVTIKAKPTDLTIAKRIVGQLDKAKAEVMIYFELLEVTESSLEQVGLLPVISASDTSGTYRIGATVDNSGSANVTKGGISISKSDLKFLFPSLALDALKSSGDAKLVANPNVRVVSGETGEVNIGEKVSTTQSYISGLGSSSSSTSSSSSSTYAQTSYSYEDVGVKIKVEPRVHFNDDITLKIETSVTTLISSSTAGRPDIGRRDIKTMARLHDGETAVFAGLLKEEEQKSLSGLWGLSDVPVLGKLLGHHYTNGAKTDVILTIRAVMVRRPDLGEEDFEAFDPDLATSQSGPFTPKAAPGKAKAEPAVAAPRPVAIPQTAPAVVAPSTGAQDTVPAPEPESALPETEAQPAKESAAPDAAQDQESQDLVLFLTPLTATIAKGEKVQLALMVSGGKGLANGTIDLGIDPKLKLTSATAGDYLTLEKGSLDPVGGGSGTVRLTFRRPNTHMDSGTLAMLEFEATASGSAPVMVQGGTYKVGANAIPAKVVNALVTVE